MTEQRLFDVAQAAKRLRRCPETIRRYIRSGLLPAIRPPGPRRRGNYLIAEADLEKFLSTSHDNLPHAHVAS